MQRGTKIERTFNTGKKKDLDLDNISDEEALHRFGTGPVKITEPVRYDMGRRPGVFIPRDGVTEAEGLLERTDLSEYSDFVLTVSATNIAHALKLRKQILCGCLKPVARHAEEDLTGWAS